MVRSIIDLQSLQTCNLELNYMFIFSFKKIQLLSIKCIFVFLQGPSLWKVLSIKTTIQTHGLGC